MIAGLLARNIVARENIIASHPRADRRERLADRFGIMVVETNDQVVHVSQLVFLTIKPQVLAPVMRELRCTLKPDQVVVSILAGASLRSLRKGFEHDAVVRVMPNTPAQIGEGMSVWC